MSSAASRRSRMLSQAGNVQIEQLEIRIMLAGLPNPPVTPPVLPQGNEPLQGVVGSPLSLSPIMMQNEWGINQIFYKVGSNVEQANGAGETIAIVDAYGSPTIQSDVAQFDNYWGLSNADSSGNFFLSVQPLGSTANSEVDDPAIIAGWGVESSLDVEWAHAMAPEAHIILVEAPSQSFLDLVDADVYAENLPGVTVVSNSWGYPVGDIQEPDRFDGFFTTPAAKANENENVTVLFSSGDDSTLQYPSASNQVLTIGGMSMDVDLNGDIIDIGDWAGSGGGSDTDYVMPYNVPAASADADPLTGVWVYDSSNNVALTGEQQIDQGWLYEIGGTSLSTPMWAGYIATIDQGLAMQGEASLSSPTAYDDILIAAEGSPTYFDNLNKQMATSYPLWPTPNGPIPDQQNTPSNGNTGFGFVNAFAFTSLIETGNSALDFLEGETKWTESGDPAYNGVVTTGDSLDRIYFANRMGASVSAGENIPNLVVDVDTPLNAVDTTFNGNVTVSLLSGGTLIGTTTVTAVEGVATFGDVSIDRAAANYVLEATASGVISGQSNPFNTVPAAAATMFVSSQPTSAYQYTATSTVKITLEDAFGNVAIDDPSTVTLTVASGPGTFSGPSSSAVDSGVAVFAGLIFTVPGTYQLEASDGADGLAPVFTDDFNVVAIPITRRSLFNGGTLSEPALIFQQQRNAAVFAAAGPPPGAAFFAVADVEGGQAAVNNVAAGAAPAASSGNSGSDVDQVLDSAANLRSDDAAAAVLNP
jgi:hypothetical protein